jgi:hypothetical protein
MIFFRLFFAMCAPINKNTNFIKNAEYPICKTCEHYLPRDIFFDDGLLGKCAKFGKKDLVTGKITYNYADFCRIDDKECGKEGKYYEKHVITFLHWL